MGGSVAQLSSTRTVQGIDIMSATAPNAALIIQVLIPKESASTHDSHLAVHWKGKRERELVIPLPSNPSTDYIISLKIKSISFVRFFFCP